MATIETQRSTVHANPFTRRMQACLYLTFISAIVVLSWVQSSSAQTTANFHRILTVTSGEAVTQKGTGRISVGGARGSFTGSTDQGDIYLKAIPHEDWQLRSASGNVRLELPPSAKFELEASTKTGELQFDREDISRPEANALQFQQAINGGGKRIAVHTESGRIVIR